MKDLVLNIRFFMPRLPLARGAFFIRVYKMSKHYKKMAGTSAVFVYDTYKGPSPVERDGMVWSEEELHIETLPAEPSGLRMMPSMANALALEGLEEYEPPEQGDVREVASLSARFVYLQAIKGWVQYQEERA
jgi:hypothetical protein